MTTVLERAMRAIPLHVQLGTAIDALRDHLDALTFADLPTVDAILADLKSDLLAGEPVPDDIVDRLIDTERQQLERDRALAHLRHFSGSLTDARTKWLLSHADATPAFDVLREELALICAETVAVDQRLGPVTALDGALADPDSAAAWSRLAILVQRYDGVRAAQTKLTGGALGNSGPAVRTLVCRHGLVDLNGAESESWPDPHPATGSWWPTGDQPGYLRWLATNDVGILPDPQDVQDAADAALSGRVVTSPYKRPRDAAPAGKTRPGPGDTIVLPSAPAA